VQLKHYILSLRKFRNWHRLLGLTLSLFLLISAITGILLALKKDIDIIQPPSQKGVSKSLDTWKSVAELSELATIAFHKAHPVFKLISMNLLGFGVLFMVGSGFWLWYGPKKYREAKRVKKLHNK